MCYTFDCFYLMTIDGIMVNNSKLEREVGMGFY